MNATTTQAPAIVVLGRSALDTARRIQATLPGSLVHGLETRVGHDADVAFTQLGDHLQALYARGAPIVALCAAGIVIRCVAPMLNNKGTEPPVLAVAEDGSAVVPLLGGLAGVNVLARRIARALDIVPAITTSGELRFGTCLLNPPAGYVLADLAQSKHFVSDLLAGETVRVEGDAPWLDDADLPTSDDAALTIRITPFVGDRHRDALVIYPRSVLAVLTRPASLGPPPVRALLAKHALSSQALAAVLAPISRMGDADLQATADELGVPLRFADFDALNVPHAPDAPDASDAPDGLDRDNANRAKSPTDARNVADWLRTTLGPDVEIRHDDQGDCGIVLARTVAPIDVARIGQARGTLTVIGLGPGDAELRVPLATAALARATDILGYATYVAMAGPLRDDQQVHATDNREELMRARHAFELASAGRHVVVVSSGDPGVFAMASAVFEALDASENPRWKAVDLRIVPGISAAMATAAVAGAPLGHDFCVLSLSDNLKPWDVIRERLRHAAQADLVMAFYNPISRARPWQLGEALDIVREWRAPDTRVVLGRDIGRPGATLTHTTLGALHPGQVDMRTMVIVGSSTTRGIDGGPHGEWIYTPRWYGEPPKR
ncbi:precorrin-3B C(17)-methyltransferase [Pandoraea anhela]|uniref:Precorrin-3B C(17)-methyltransferase n=1 Tax=Pandoraea anhela TaxID=2508295 RepID=A0A5E4W496_9BURK|nr:precorrin-3B C(17)-methyltransferase [Pandoraea anhela]